MKVITLCGSIRFRKEFEEWNEKLTLQGNVVISVEGFNTSLTDEQKKLLELVHRRKIDLADEIFVIDVDGYIGESTSKEIEYAIQTGKPVRYLSECK
jgi:hypothetical protein